MKLYNKIGILAVGALTLASCAKNDPFADNMQLGQKLPTVAWELGSTTCKAGGEASFKGKYYFDNTDDQVTNIDHSEIWALISKSESAEASVKLISSYSYTMTEVINDTVRSSQLIKRYEHKALTWNAAKNIADFNKQYDAEGTWEDEGGKYNSDYHIDRTNGYEYVLYASIPTSRTLSPVKWASPAKWDQEKFDQLYSKDFQSKFVAKVVDDLTKDSTYYNGLRDAYLNYDFTAAQLQEIATKNNVTFPVVTDAAEKGDAWQTYHAEAWKDGEGKTQPATPVVGKYYSTVIDGVRVYKEVALDAQIEGVVLYDVYQSSPWVFCRYDDDLGKVISTVRSAYMPFFKDLVAAIPFTEWIHNYSDGSFAVTFSRKYKLYPVFKVVGTNNKVGYSTDDKEIELN